MCLVNLLPLRSTEHLLLPRFLMYLIVQAFDEVVEFAVVATQAAEFACVFARAQDMADKFEMATPLVRLHEVDVLP